MVADEDNVAIAYTVTGTQKGPFQGIPASGKKIKARGVQIAKFNKDGKIIERWGSSDEMGIMQQIGVSKPLNRCRNSGDLGPCLHRNLLTIFVVDRDAPSWSLASERLHRIDACSTLGRQIGGGQSASQ